MFMELGSMLSLKVGKSVYDELEKDDPGYQRATQNGLMSRVADWFKNNF